MGILSNSINILSKSISRFISLSSSLTHTTRVSGDSKGHNRVNLLLGRRHKGFIYHTRISSTDQDRLRYDPLDYPNTSRTQYFFPSASCNALLFAYFNDRMLSSALWNPTTDEVKGLPRSSVPRPIEAYIISCGLGFDRASQDYKVIRFLMFDTTHGELDFQVELYSLRSDSWKEITCPCLPVAPRLDKPSIHINGFSYWVTPSGFILSFDFANEEFSTVPLPKIDKLNEENQMSNILLAQFDGSLAILVYSVDPYGTAEEKPFEFEVWVWKDESWTRVLLPQMIDHVHGVEKPVGLFNNDKFYFQDSKGQLFLFDCCKRELKNLDLNADRNWVYLLPYVESDEPIGA